MMVRPPHTEADRAPVLSTHGRTHDSEALIFAPLLGLDRHRPRPHDPRLRVLHHLIRDDAVVEQQLEHLHQGDQPGHCC